MYAKMTQDEIDDYNMSAKGSDPKLICIVCREETSLDDSFSDCRRNLHCKHCVSKYVREGKATTIANYCSKYIWK